MVRWVPSREIGNIFFGFRKKVKLLRIVPSSENAKNTHTETREIYKHKNNIIILVLVLVLLLPLPLLYPPFWGLLYPPQRATITTSALFAAHRAIHHRTAQYWA